MDSYVNASYAFQNGLVYVEDDGTVIMKGDNTSWLASGQYRDRWATRHLSNRSQHNNEPVSGFRAKLSTTQVFLFLI